MCFFTMDVRLLVMTPEDNLRSIGPILSKLLHLHVCDKKDQGLELQCPLNVKDHRSGGDNFLQLKSISKNIQMCQIKCILLNKIGTFDFSMFKTHLFGF